MSSTNKTTNYELSQFVGTDKPTYLGDYNGDMLKIDTQMKSNADNIASNTSAISTASANASTALSTAGTAQSTAESAQTTANTANNTATNALSKANTNESNIADLNKKFEYKTSEEIIGSWLGKPLYRKVVSFSNITVNAGENRFNHGIANLKHCIHAEMTDPTQWYIFPYIWNTSREMTGINAVGSSYFTIASTANWGTINSLQVVFEYTKTTDD